jgi:hypothetical protein
VPDASPYIRFNTNKYGRIVGTGSDVCDHTPVNSLGPSDACWALLGRCKGRFEKAGILRVYAESQWIAASKTGYRTTESRSVGRG